MAFRVTRIAAALALVACLGFSGSLFANQIEAISSDYLASSFANSGGAYSLGTLTIDDNADIVVEYLDDTTAVFPMGHVFLTTSLFQDLSSGGVADGLFLGGSILLEKADGTDLLTATVDQMEVKELAAQPDILVGFGRFTVTGGTLAADFGAWGEVFQLTFNLVPSGIQNFTDGSGAGMSDVKLTPVPEPATLLLVGTAGLSFVGWLRRRRMAA